MRCASYAILFLGLSASAFGSIEAPAETVREFCAIRLADLGSKVPQLMGVTGHHHDLTYFLSSWPQLREGSTPETADDRRNHGSSFVADDIARHTVAYGRDDLQIETTDEKALVLLASIKYLVFELFNNAAFHGNQGDERQKILIRVQMSNEEVVIRISDRGHFFDLAPYTIAMTFEETCEFVPTSQGGGLGLRFALPTYVERGFGVRSEKRDDGDGIARTDAVITIPVRHGLTTMKDE